MSEIEIIANGGRRRYWPAEEKVRIVEETLGGESISSVARRNGVAPIGTDILAGAFKSRSRPVCPTLMAL